MRKIRIFHLTDLYTLWHNSEGWDEDEEKHDEMKRYRLQLLSQKPTCRDYYKKKKTMPNEPRKRNLLKIQLKINKLQNTDWLTEISSLHKNTFLSKKNGVDFQEKKTCSKPQVLFVSLSLSVLATTVLSSFQVYLLLPPRLTWEVGVWCVVEPSVRRGPDYRDGNHNNAQAPLELTFVNVWHFSRRHKSLPTK